MGKVLQSVGKLLGGSAPKVSNAAPEIVEEDEGKTKKRKSAIYNTEGGAAGQELQPGQVKGRSTLLGN